MGDEELKIEDLESSEVVYPLSSESAQRAVKILQSHFIEVITNHPGTKIQRNENVITVQLNSVCRPTDIKHALDQIVYVREDIPLVPRKFEVHFFPDQRRLEKFFDLLRDIPIRNEFVLIFNGVDPTTSSLDIIKPNIHLCGGKLIMGVWVSISAVATWKMDTQQMKIERQREEMDRQQEEMDRQQNEIERANG